MQRSLIPLLFWILLSLFMMLFSHDIGLGEFRSPGPGLMPFLVGVLLFLISLYALIRFVSRKKGAAETSEKAGSELHFRKIGLVLFFLLVYALLLEKVGYLITTFLMLILLFRTAGVNRWRFALIISGVTALVTYVFFGYLGLRFPAGVLGIGGFLR
jgi:putative tricarboxylic transport membrane protein